MTRQQKIQKGKLWQIYFDKTPEDIIFESTKSGCFAYLRRNYCMAQYKQGMIRIGQLIWEK